MRNRNRLDSARGLPRCFRALMAVGVWTSAAFGADVTGRVMSEFPDRPLAGAQVTLKPTDAGARSLSASTGADGRFVFSSVPVGPLQIVIEKTGYFPLSFPGEVDAGEGLALGDTVLVAKRLIAGVVRSRDNRGVPGALVQVLRVRAGRPAFVKTEVGLEASLTGANSQGEFRHADLEPGKYLLVVTVRGGRRAAAPVFHPGGEAPDLVQAIDLRQAAEATGLSIFVDDGPGVSVEGRISTDGPVPAGHFVGVTLVAPGAPMPIAETAAGADGTFTFPEVPRGTYLLILVAGDPSAGMTKAVEPLVVGREPVRDLNLRAPTPLAIEGALDLEAAPPGFEKNPGVAGIEIRLLSARLGVLGRPRPPRTDAQGRFRLAGLAAGEEYELTVAGMPAGCYLARVSQGGRTSSISPFFVRGAPEPVRLVIRGDGARIRGQVRAGPGRMYRTLVAAVRRHPGPPALIEAVRPDRQGRFSVWGLPAGTYTVLAADRDEADSWTAEDLAALLKERGNTVTLAPAETREGIELVSDR